MLLLVLVLPILDPSLQLGLQARAVGTFIGSVLLAPPSVFALRRYTGRSERGHLVE